jgi:phage virion morphogenesis protein
MMAGATFDVDFNSLAAQDSLNQLLLATGDIKPALREIGEYLLIADRQRFEAQIAPDGSPWAPLSPRYLRRKKKNQNRILVLEGRLMNNRRYQVGENELQFGSNEPYAAIQHFGGEIEIPARTRTLYFKHDGKGNVGNQFVKKKKSNFAQDVQGKAHKIKIPARPNLGTSDADNLEILEIVIDHLDRALE